MKTQSNIQKTTESQMKNMISRAGAVVIGIVLLSWTVSAQDFWKHLLTDNNYGKMVLMIVEQNAEFEKADAAAETILAEINERNTNSAEVFELETETEKNLEVEDWMTDEKLFSANRTTFAEETDHALILESWMIHVNSNKQSISVQDENEAALKVEDWMTNEANFNSIELKAEKDTDLEIESWMLEESHFKSNAEQANEPLKLEEWMADANFWGF